MSNRIGVNATYDEEFPTGWQHIVARRARSQLAVFLNGQLVAESAMFEPAHYDLSITAPFQIGFGANDNFLGGLRDVRIYHGALSPEAIRALAK
jgi:hypothetical protein